jgi:hypothetical protein
LWLKREGGGIEPRRSPSIVRPLVGRLKTSRLQVGDLDRLDGVRKFETEHRRAEVLRERRGYLAAQPVNFQREGPK